MRPDAPPDEALEDEHCATYATVTCLDMGRQKRRKVYKSVLVARLGVHHCCSSRCTRVWFKSVLVAGLQESLH